MLSIHLVKAAAPMFYFYLTVIYPIKETFSALKFKSFTPAWIKLLTYWLVYIVLLLIEPILAFMTDTLYYRICKGLFLYLILRKDESIPINLCVRFMLTVNYLLNRIVFPILIRLYTIC